MFTVVLFVARQTSSRLVILTHLCNFCCNSLRDPLPGLGTCAVHSYTALCTWFHEKTREISNLVI
jgi:hypothetical protein